MPVIARFHHPRATREDRLKKQSLDAEAERLLSIDQEAAKKIQSCWRGKRSRQALKNRLNKRKNRHKPWGFFTHSLVLTSQAQLALPDLESSASTKRWIWLLLEDPGSSPQAQALSIFIIGFIILSIAGFILETVPSIYRASPAGWNALEVACTGVFSLEYITRLIVCEEGSVSQLKFIFTPMNIFDAMAVVPFYIEVILRSLGAEDTPALRVFRLVRLVRVIRIFKLGRYATGMRLFGEALAGSTTAISVLIFMMGMGVVVFSSAVFYIEKLSCPELEDLTALEAKVYHSDCDDPFYRGVSPTHGLCCTEEGSPRDFPSVIAAFWWSLVTMTSVGYGDVYPRTTQGKFVGFIAMLVGMVLIALPVAIVGQKFQDVYDNHDLEEAKRRAAVRMKVMGEVWALEPRSDVLARMGTIKVNDPALGNSVSELTSFLKEVWEQREQLMRERKYEFDRQEDINSNLDKLLRGMGSVLDDRNVLDKS